MTILLLIFIVDFPNSHGKLVESGIFKNIMQFFYYKPD